MTWQSWCLRFAAEHGRRVIRDLQLHKHMYIVLIRMNSSLHIALASLSLLCFLVSCLSSLLLDCLVLLFVCLLAGSAYSNQTMACVCILDAYSNWFTRNYLVLLCICLWWDGASCIKSTEESRTISGSGPNIEWATLQSEPLLLYAFVLVLLYIWAHSSSSLAAKKAVYKCVQLHQYIQLAASRTSIQRHAHVLIPNFPQQPCTHVKRNVMCPGICK